MLEKNVTNEHNNVSEIVLWHCFVILTLIVVTGKIQYVFMLLTKENTILSLKS